MRNVLRVAVVVSLCYVIFQLNNIKSYNENTLDTFTNYSVKETQKDKELKDRFILYQELQIYNVKIDAVYGSGSGVIVSRVVAGVQKYYVWTAGHVVELVKESDGTFGDLTVISENRVDGKLYETSKYKAKVIAYSPSEGGHDLALLEIIDDCFFACSAKFSGVERERIGTEIIHCGSPLGLEDSLSLGVMSQTDRDILEDGKLFDQTSCMGYPGSSGGGVFTMDGMCIGLLTRGAGAGLNFIVPTRRIIEFAKDANVMWAVDESAEVPLVRQPTSLEGK